MGLGSDESLQKICAMSGCWQLEKLKMSPTANYEAEHIFVPYWMMALTNICRLVSRTCAT